MKMEFKGQLRSPNGEGTPLAACHSPAPPDDTCYPRDRQLEDLLRDHQPLRCPAGLVETVEVLSVCSPDRKRQKGMWHICTLPKTANLHEGRVLDSTSAESFHSRHRPDFQLNPKSSPETPSGGATRHADCGDLCMINPGVSSFT